MKALWINREDNVAVVLEDVPEGAAVEAGGICLTAGEEIPKGHKIALERIPKGASVVKYGVPIGKAGIDIPAGSFVHTHNVLDVTSELCRKYAEDYRRKEAE